MSGPAAVPRSLVDNPLVSQWLALRQDGTVRLAVGKVELGQGILTALAQIAAEELDVELSRIQVVAGDTRDCPDEWYTAGSFSVQVSGAAVRQAAAQARRLFLDAAAQRLGGVASELVVEDGTITLRVEPVSTASTSYWALLDEVDLRVPVAAAALPAWRGPGRIVGRDAPRLDLPGKIAGSGFIHDMDLPGMLHARVVRPPAPGARLRQAPEAVTGALGVLRDGDFLAIWAADEFSAVRAAERLRRAAVWDVPEASVCSPQPEELTKWPARTTEVHAHHRTNGAGDGSDLRAVYTRPYTAHAAIGPCCAIARFASDGSGVLVWTHSQGVFPLRAQLARVFGLALDRVDVVHAHGAGCYGHNGADDAALDAALVARATQGAPVRVVWSREDEFAWSPASSAMRVALDASIHEGRISRWRLDVWSGPHGQRPGWNGDVNLLAAGHLATPFVSRPLEADVAPALGGGGDRNAVAPYDIADHEVHYHFIPDLPLRVSSLRTLGGFANVFAIESFMDELAEAAGADPLDFRLAHLTDPRARDVLQAVWDLASLTPETPAEGLLGRGLAFSRYKNSAAYAAVVAEVELAEQVSLSRVWCVVDAGLAINPDGVRNQMEGGIIQAASWTLKEALPIDALGVTARSWDDYPILRFDEVPLVRVEVLQRGDQPPLGVGEAAHGPTAAAIANAVARAAGVRVRDLPLTRDRIAAVLASG